MAHGEFLRLLQLVDAHRKVVSRDSMEIRDEDVVTADAIDGHETSHLNESAASEHEAADCEHCIGIERDRAMLWEKLHSQGQDFPTDVFFDVPTVDLPQSG